MEFENCINFLLAAAQRKAEKDLGALLAPYDVTSVQYGVLNSLWQRDKKNPKEIADELRLETPTITGMVERMEKKGLLVRRMSDADRRFIDICLTDKGRALEEPVQQVVERFHQMAFADFSADERDSLKKMLIRLYSAEKAGTPAQ